ALDGNFTCGSRLTADVPHVLMRMEINKRKTFTNLLRFRSKIADLKPDLMLTYNFGAIEWALANRFRPVISHIHFEVGFGAEEAIAQFKRRILLRRIALSGKSRVVVNSRTLQSIARRVWKIDQDRLLFIPNGVDCDRFAIEPDLREYPQLYLDRPKALIGTVAALRPEKNISRLIRSVVPIVNNFDARLLIVGD